ncbi:apolipoprotein N-acyltransferase [Gleimia sp. 6138-11-ORH1]|uniref:apolipoprotein N-acyltransferase n=1 Tax=Gleimia sp. 6138-11-ORH1 TaxID=2973937 RepID=UPI0021685834|nr:apolipoprotein N-acyltransferase [Gleimia sp. 6138-11-ORH1]MCS4484350.1 apolipoprotein N-acyltransferase [Gleimia sp. 6138-11-ORH1]
MRQPYVLTVLAGLCMYAGFPPLYFWPGVICALGLLLLAFENQSVRVSFTLGWLFGVVFMSGHIWWAYVTTESLFLWFVSVNIQALFFGLLGVFWYLLRDLTSVFWYRAISFALLWPAIEQLRGHFPFTGFPWAYAAYALVDSPLRAWAPFGGEVLLSGVAGFLGALCYGIFTHRLSKTVPILAAGLVVFAVPLLLPIPPTVSAGSLTVGVVQGNVEEPVRVTYRTANKVFNNHLNETERLLAETNRPIDVIFWGETAIDLDPLTDGGISWRLQDLSRRAQAPIVTGYVSGTETERYNLYGVWTENGKAEGAYAKQMLVPFGEYLPGFLQFGPFLELYRYGVGELSFGKQPGKLNVNLGDYSIPVGVGICFESGFEGVFANAQGPLGKLLVVPTNNSSFGWTAQSAQQLQMVQLRALEFQRPAIQVSTNGISAIVSHRGEVLQQTQLFTSEHLIETVDLRDNVGGFYGIHGWPIRELVMLFPLMLLLIKVAQFLSKRTFYTVKAPAADSTDN